MSMLKHCYIIFFIFFQTLAHVTYFILILWGVKVIDYKYLNDWTIHDSQCTSMYTSNVHNIFQEHDYTNTTVILSNFDIIEKNM